MKTNQKNNFIKEWLQEDSWEKTSGLSYSFLAVLPTLFSLVVFILLAINGLDILLAQETDWFLYVSFLIPQLSLACVSVWAIQKKGKGWKETFARQKCEGKYYLLAIILQIGLLFLSQVNTWFLEFLERFGYEDTSIRLPSMDGFGLVGVFLVVAVLPAVMEEIFFRGVLLRGVKGFGTVWAVLLCGGLFALYHQNPVQTLYQFCCGTAFALVAVKAGSVLPTIVSHFINNATVILLMKFNVEELTSTLSWTLTGISLVCLVGALGYLIFIDKNKAEKTQANKKSFFLFASVGIVVCALTWLIVLLQGL